jgi:hypothetical protein
MIACPLSIQGRLSKESYNGSSRTANGGTVLARTSAPELDEKDFDLTSPVFAGSDIQQKFTNKSSYDRRFVWLNIKSRSIHMSQHMTKDRRHKEASLADVTSVIFGPPLKSKLAINDKHSLTVHFKRGGGIDLLFSSESECLLWFHTLNKICQSSEFFVK